MLPNFFIAGAPKAGTDELYYDLEQHPEIYMSPLKESNYFSEDIRSQYMHPSLRQRAAAEEASLRRYLDEGASYKRFGGIVTELSDYQRLFSLVREEKAIGDGSVIYLWSKTAAARIASAVPHARIIIVLMDPAERAFHQYLKSVSDGTVRHSFRKHLNEAMKAQGSELSVYHPFLELGNYFEQVGRYKSCFPPDQLHITLYEDLLANHRAWFADVLSFLNVDSKFIPQPVEVPSKPHIPRFEARGLKKIAKAVLPTRLRTSVKRLAYRSALPQLKPEDRTILVNYYRDDVLGLQDLIGRNLSAWLR
jgi:hypothetical protein